MFEKNMRFAYLLDCYAEVLDEHARGIMRAYYEDDLSLSEIAEGEEISRQGVRHLIKKGEEQLLFLEERLGLAYHHGEIGKAAKNLSLLAEHLKNGEISPADAAERIDALANLIVSKGV